MSSQISATVCFNRISICTILSRLKLMDEMVLLLPLCRRFSTMYLLFCGRFGKTISILEFVQTQLVFPSTPIFFG